jgi:hypothetical protein
MGLSENPLPIGATTEQLQHNVRGRCGNAVSLVFMIESVLPSGRLVSLSRTVWRMRNKFFADGNPILNASHLTIYHRNLPFLKMQFSRDI